MKYQTICIFLLVGYLSICLAQQKSNIIEKINGKEYYIHQVKKGESLYGISKLYGVESDVILSENPSIKEKGLKAGYNILIPLHTQTVQISKPNTERDTLNYQYHKVQKGQTVYSLCKQYNISVDEFYMLNPDKKTGIREDDWVIVGKKQRTAIPIQEVKTAVHSTVVLEYHFPKKTRYDVVLLLPFGADKSESIVVEDMLQMQNNFPPMSSMMIDFYKGLEYAIDSLKSDSFDVRLFPFDVNEKDSMKLLEIIHLQEYKNADIAIGPLFSSLIKTEQNSCVQKKCHIIPFITNNKFLFNHPEYSKTSPSVFVDIQVLANYVFDSLSRYSKVVVLTTNQNSDKEYAKEFKRYYNEKFIEKKLKDTVRTFRSIQEFKQYMREKENYTVVLLTNNQVIATDYITQMSIINKTSPINLCGFYKNILYDNLDLEYLNQMRFTFVYYQNLNYAGIFSKYVKKYQAEFQTDPSLFFYEGLQIGLYYFNLLKKYGIDAMYRLNEYSYDGKDGFMRFQFYRPDELTGFQNNAEFVYRVIDRKIILQR